MVERTAQRQCPTISLIAGTWADRRHSTVPGVAVSISVPHRDAPAWRIFALAQDRERRLNIPGRCHRCQCDVQELDVQIMRIQKAVLLRVWRKGKSIWMRHPWLCVGTYVIDPMSTVRVSGKGHSRDESLACQSLGQHVVRRRHA